MKKELQSLKLFIPSKSTEIYFFLGLVIFYLIIFLSPNKIIYFSAYFISTIFFYLSTKNLWISLLFSLILSLFSDVGLGASLFLMQPEELRLGSGWFISPMTVLLFCLLPFSLKKEHLSKNKIDLIVLLFLLWNIFSFVIYPYQNVLYGVIFLSELILLYYVLRVNIKRENLSSIIHILISLLIFQIGLGFVQFLLGRPIGIIAEGIGVSTPYGFTTIEDRNIFRITGTFAHPNFFASFLLITIPFIILYKTKYSVFSFLKIFSVLAVIFTYSRAAWIIFTILAFLMLGTAKFYQNIRKKLVSKSIVALIIFVLAVFILLQPYIYNRLHSFSLAFAERGSFAVRLATYQEALSIVQQFPLVGVGLYRSIEYYAYNPVSETFKMILANRALGIHNTFLEIAAETGIPGFIIFTLFLVLVFRHYFHLKNKSNSQKAAFYGLIGLIGMSMFNPFFHSSQFRLFFLLSAIILV